MQKEYNEYVLCTLENVLLFTLISISEIFIALAIAVFLGHGSNKQREKTILEPGARSNISSNSIVYYENQYAWHP